MKKSIFNILSLPKALILCMLLQNTLFAKKDFYFNYVNNNNEQVSDKFGKEVAEGSYLLDEIQNDIDDEKIFDARAKILEFRTTNNIKILKPRSDYLYSLILYKQNNPFTAGEAIEILNSLIEKSQVKNQELIKVMYLLSQLNMIVKNEQQAKYWAKNIFKTFDSKKAHLQGYKAISRLYFIQKKHKQAIKLLKKAIDKLKNEDGAALLFDELYLHLLATSQEQKAKKVAQASIRDYLDFYSKKLVRIKRKVKILRKGSHKKLAIEFLQALLNEQVSDKQRLDYIRFEIANTYMDIDTKSDEYRLKAKELYEQIMVGATKNKYYNMAKLRRDEVLMREDKIGTNIFYKRYVAYEDYRERGLVQELIFALRDKEYELLLKKASSKFDDSIFKNYGYTSQKVFYDLVYDSMVDDAISKKQCANLEKYTTLIGDKKILRILDDPKKMPIYIDCLLARASLDTYRIFKILLKDTQDARMLFFLEKLALKLGRYEQAYKYSKQVQRSGDASILKEELLYGLESVIVLDSRKKYDSYFRYVDNNPQYEKYNMSNPAMIDFYYHYYQYLMRRHEDTKAFKVLKKLYNAQMKNDIHLHSPFVEVSLASNFYMNNGFENTIKVIDSGFKNSKKIENEDLIQMYYYKSKAYSGLKDPSKAKAYAIKCLQVGVKSIYKNLCKAIIKQNGN